MLSSVSSQIVIFSKLHKSMLYVMGKLGNKYIQCYWKQASSSAPNVLSGGQWKIKKFSLSIICKWSCALCFVGITSESGRFSFSDILAHVFLQIVETSSCLIPESVLIQSDELDLVCCCGISHGINSTDLGNFHSLSARTFHWAMPRALQQPRQNCFAIIHWVKELNWINLIRFVLNKSKLAAFYRLMILLGW